MRSDFSAAVFWRAVRFPPEGIYTSSTDTIIDQMPELVAISCTGGSDGAKRPFRGSDRAMEGTGNSGTKCEEAAGKMS